MANGNPFYISPAASQGAMQGLASLGTSFIQKRQQDQAMEAQQAAQQEIQGALASNDPMQIQQVMAKYPDMAGQIEAGFGFRNEATRQNMADTAFRILQGEDAATVLQDRAAFVQQMGGDPTQTLEGLDLEPEELQQSAMIMLAQYGTPQQMQMVKGLLAGPEIGEGTANIEDWREYQRLKRTAPEDAKQFGMGVGFVQPDGKELSSHLQKRLSMATDAAIESESIAASMEGLAQEFADANVGGGAAQGKWREAYKDFTGQQDAVTELRKRYNAIRGSQVVKNLPPGAASDTDIQLALSGFPSDNAPGVQIESFLRGVAKLEREKAKFENFKANFISENASERGLLKAWRDFVSEQEAALPEPLPGVTQGAGTVGGALAVDEPPAPVETPSGEPTLEELLQQYGGS